MSKPDYVVTCPNCKNKSLGRWGDHYICSNCGAHRISLGNDFIYYGITKDGFSKIEEEEIELIAKGLIPGKRKVVINVCHGGLSLSHKAFLKLRELKNKYALEETDWGEHYPNGSGPKEERWDMFLSDIPRDDPDLVSVVEELGDEANGRFAELKIVEIPDNVEFVIAEYDGWETIEEKHRVWG